MTFAFGIFDSFDLGAGTAGDIVEQRLELALEAERLGITHYHVTDHHGTPLSVVPAPNLFLAALSRQTTRMRLGAMIYVLPSYEPLRLAEEVAVLDHLAGGRIDVGVGSGISPYELAYFGVPGDEAKDRYNRMLPALVDAWRTGILHNPEHPDRPAATLSLRPVQQPNPPVWYVVASTGSAEWAGANAVHILGRWNGGRFVEAAEAYWRAFRDDRAADPINAVEPGGEPPVVGIAGPVIIADSEAEAHDRFARAGEVHRQRAIALWNENGDHAADHLFDTDRMIETRNALVGTSDQVRDQLVAMIEEADISMYEAQLYEGDMSFDEARDNLHRFAALMPAVRDAHAAAQARRASVSA